MIRLFILVFLCLSGFSGFALSLTLSERQICDLELLFNQGFAPLEEFMDRANYDRVVHEMRLLDGTLWPMPIVLDVSEKIKEKIEVSDVLSLCDPEGTVLARLEVAEIWRPDKEKEAKKVYGTLSQEHPGVAYLFEKMGAYYISGQLRYVSPVKHYDFLDYRKTPDQMKAYFKEKGIDRIVAFQTRNPMHRAHVELTLRAAQETGAHLLLHPAVGVTKPGDVDYFTRVKCYRHLLSRYPDHGATLSLLPIAMRMAGPREALWHAIIRKNYGCTHFIVGRDHAGPGKDREGIDFYPPYAAQELVEVYADEIGIEVVPFKEMVYVPEDDNYQPIDETAPFKLTCSLSGTELRQLLKNGGDIPSWFSYPEVIVELRKAYPPRKNQGFTLFLTGLPGAGKSTIANALVVKLMELQDRPITLLDGDLIRIHLSTELGFSKEHRSLNVRRVGFVASQIVKNRGIAICALIAPYEEDRLANRKLIEDYGNYIEIFVDTPLAVCEKRDPKGLYALARMGKISSFTGIDDPYEPPQYAQIRIDTAEKAVEESVDLIVDYLRKEGYIF